MKKANIFILIISAVLFLSGCNSFNAPNYDYKVINNTPFELTFTASCSDLYSETVTIAPAETKTFTQLPYLNVSLKDKINGVKQIHRSNTEYIFDYIYKNTKTYSVYNKTMYPVKITINKDVYDISRATVNSEGQVVIGSKTSITTVIPPSDWDFVIYYNSELTENVSDNFKNYILLVEE